MRFRPEQGLGDAALSSAGGRSGSPPGGQNGVVVERPPPGLARGRYPASPWAIGFLGAALLLITVGYFYMRARKLRS